MENRNLHSRVRADTPIRTCCGCVGRDAQRSMVRITDAMPSGLQLDLTRRQAGRGAYLHRVLTCWESFRRGKPFVPSLRRRVSVAERSTLIEALHAARLLDPSVGAV